MKLQKRVVIVGGGFGGIKVALELAKHHDFVITLVTKNNLFNYYPSLFHTATGGSRIVSSIPIGELFANKPIQVIKGEATKIDKDKQVLVLKTGKKIPYDTLVLSMGVVTNYFGIKGLEANSHTVKSLEKAEQLKRYLQAQLIDARTPDMNYVVVGAGATGIEFASMLPGYIHELMRKFNIGRKAVRVELIEARPQILPMLPKKASKVVKKRLQKLGVHILTNKTVKGETASQLILVNQVLESKTVVWTAGVTNNPFFAKNQFSLSERGKVIVDEFLGVGHGIYVIGDNAETKYSGMAQTALHDALSLSKNLVREFQGQPMQPYKIKKPVYIIPVGERWAIVIWGKLVIYGWLGWSLRVAADWLGYRDFEPWWKATARSMAMFVDED